MPDTTTNYGFTKPSAMGEKFPENVARNFLDQIDTALAAVAAAGAWTAYTPTLSAFSGSLTSATAAGRYRQTGKTIFVRVQINITTNGTAAGNISATLPAAAHATNDQTLGGRETLLTGKALAGTIAAGASAVQINFYDNAYPGANGNRLVVEGVYEAA